MNGAFLVGFFIILCSVAFLVFFLFLIGDLKIAHIVSFFDRNERAYRKLVEKRAGQYMRLGMSPVEARKRAARELEREAEETLGTTA